MGERRLRVSGDGDVRLVSAPSAAAAAFHRCCFRAAGRQPMAGVVNAVLDLAALRDVRRSGPLLAPARQRALGSAKLARQLRFAKITSEDSGSLWCLHVGLRFREASNYNRISKDVCKPVRERYILNANMNERTRTFPNVGARRRTPPCGC